MQKEMVYSAEQLARLQAKLADVKEELKREEKTAVPDIGDNSYMRVSDDAMTVWLFLGAPPENSAGYVTKNIMAYLKSEGIHFGVSEEKINDILIRRLYDKEIEVATGTPMVEGQDGYYEYKFSPESHRAPKILEDGSVDYTSMHMLQNVRAGDILAIYHHAVQGEDGRNVYGTILKPAIAKEMRPMRGRNILTKEDDPDVFISAIDGKVEVKDDRIDIQNTHEIQGDVDLIIGKIEFYGDIIINGNVEAGVILRAGRNIVIRGTAEAVTMYAGGDIILERGVQGGQKAKLSARGNVFAEFIEHCSVEAGGDVQANAIMNSKVLSGGNVILTGKRGRIIGGYTHGMKGIQAVSIGNMSEVHTVVHAGFEAKTYEELLRLSAEEQEVNEELKKIVEEMATILRNRQQKGSVLKSLEAKLPVLNKKKDELFGTLDKLRSDIAFTRELLEKGRGSKIEVNGPIYRGVIISIENMQMPVEDTTSFMRYQNHGGLIEGNVLVYK